MSTPEARVLVFSSLFPHEAQPLAGIFIRERMFRVAKRLPVVVVSPVPWFPMQHLLRMWKPHFRPGAVRQENQEGILILRPRFLSVPGLFKAWDGFFMAIGSFLTIRKLRREFAFDLIDAHFAYPDGYAASLLGRWFDVPITITLRGTEKPLSRFPARRERIIRALQGASRIFSVSASLKTHAVELGIAADKILVVGNGVDTSKFFPVEKKVARQELAIGDGSKVLISVGGLVPRKGFHRVIEVLPKLLQRYPHLVYLIVGGASPEGDIHQELEEQVAQLNLEGTVRFLGSLPSDNLRIPLSSADVFVLATANEGWANVFLEAMACGLPVITTDVGGNREVVKDETLGRIVPFGEQQALYQALDVALGDDWHRDCIVAYANKHDWNSTVEILCREFVTLCAAYKTRQPLRVNEHRDVV